MKYIDRNRNELIIKTPIHHTITKQTLKNGETTEIIKYVANIPQEVLVYILESLEHYSEWNETVTEYIDRMIYESNNEIYLSFYHDGNKKLKATNYKIDKNDGVSVRVRKRKTSNTYYFTVSKKFFTRLQKQNRTDFQMAYYINLDRESFEFKNFSITVDVL